MLHSNKTYPTDLRRYVILLGIISVSLIALSQSMAFVRETLGGTPAFWPNAHATVNLQFGCPQSGPLPNWGPCWDDAATDALNHWNNVATRFRFVRQTPAVAANPCTGSDRVNTAAFAPTLCGSGFGDALAVTTTTGFDDGTLIDTDIVVSTGQPFSTYPGPQQKNSAGMVITYDFHRVIMHELGHVLGLDHPDDHGQFVVALMNSHASDLDDVQADDIAGVNTIYPSSSVLDGTALLEDPNPQLGETVSGITIIRGWVCSAGQIDLQIDGTSFQAAYPTSRPDTQPVCGTSDTGFSFLFNWNRLGDGVHTVVALKDGVEFGRASVNVVTLGQEFLTGLNAQYLLPGFPTSGKNVVIQWRESLQNFVIVGEQ